MKRGMLLGALLGLALALFAFDQHYADAQTFGGGIVRVLVGGTYEPSAVSEINFASGFTKTRTAGRLNITASGGGHTIADEASALTARSTLNFTGAGIACTDNAGSTRTDCTVSGGYQTVGVDGSSQTQRGRANVVAGSGVTVAGADNSGTNSTDLTLSLDGFYTATVSTTDGTQTTCTSVPIASNSVSQVECRITGIRTSDNAAGGTYCRRAGYINTAGTVSRIDGAVTACGTADGETAAVSAWDVTLDVSTTNVRARVTGAAATNATWGCKCYRY